MERGVFLAVLGNLSLGWKPHCCGLVPAIEHTPLMLYWSCNCIFLVGNGFFQTSVCVSGFLVQAVVGHLSLGEATISMNCWLA